MARLRTIAGESLRSLGANMSTTLAATVTVLIGMFLLGLFIALWSWAHSYDRQLKSQLAVRVYFCTASTCAGDATKQQENTVAARLNGDPRIQRVEFVSKEQALDIMRKKQPEAVKVLPANPFPDALKVQGESRTDIRAKVPEVLNLVGLSHKMNSYPDELSGGEQQRVSIARAFVNHPPLLVCDEPTGNLDPDTSVGIMQLLYRINRSGTTILMVTHDREMVDKMRRRVIALEDGRLARDERRGGYES